MKRIIYTLFGLSATALFLLGNQGGPAKTQNRGLTGAPGDATVTCTSCHNSGTFAPTAAFSLFDSAGTVAARNYQPSKVYTIRLTITASSGTPGGYGFQMIDLLKKDSSNVKGFLLTQATGIQITTISSGRQYAEHNVRNASNTFNVLWRAPAAGSGTVIFYGVGNATNANNATSGDNGTPSTNIELQEARVATNELADNIQINLVPNPITEGVNIRLMSNASRSLQIRISDIAGRTVAAETWQVSVGGNERTLDLSRLAKGTYMVQVIENQSVVSKKMLKL